MAPLTHPAELSEALGIPFSAQQLAAITAPLEPSVIIARAGSGKPADIRGAFYDVANAPGEKGRM